MKQLEGYGKSNPSININLNTGFTFDYASKCIDANKHNHVTTTYYLLLRKYIANGGKSIADISSEHFESSLIVPNKREKKSKNSIFS